MRFIDINVLRQMIHYLLYMSIKWTVFCHLPIYYLMFCLLQNTYLSTIFHQIVLKLKYISWKMFYNICDKHSLLLDVCTFPFYRDYLVHYSYQSHCSMFPSQWMKDCGSGTEYEFICIILVKILKIIPRRLALFNACLKKINIR